MRSLKNLVEKLPIPGLKESLHRKIIAEHITIVCGIPVVARSITIRESVVFVVAPPVLKSLLGIRKKEILEQLTKEGITVSDIR